MGTKAHIGCGREPWDSTAVTFKIFNNWDSLDCGHSIGAGTWDFPVVSGRPVGGYGYLGAKTEEHFNITDAGRTSDPNPSPKPFLN